VLEVLQPQDVRRATRAPQAAAEAIRNQQTHLRTRWPQTPPARLFPSPHCNPDGTRPVSSGTFRIRLNRWQADIGLHDETGQLVQVTPHQFRHTLGTRLINQDVPQHVVQKLLGHASPQMTARYATIHDATVRAAFDDYQQRRVDVHGHRLDFDPDAAAADAEWVKHNLARVAASLPNGYCGRPPQQDCPHPNAERVVALAAVQGQELRGRLEVRTGQATRRAPMRADNRQALERATRHRTEVTRERARAALRCLDGDGSAVTFTFTAVATAAGVSRSLLYATRNCAPRSTGSLSAAPTATTARRRRACQRSVPASTPGHRAGRQSVAARGEPPPTRTDRRPPRRAAGHRYAHPSTTAHDRALPLTPHRSVSDMSLTESPRSRAPHAPPLQITVNLTTKQIKRVGRGFTNFDNYRLRLLLRCGGCNWQTQPAARIRGRRPRFVA
jgi:hypothetical protein